MVSGLGYLGFWPFTGFKGILWGTEQVYKGSILAGREHSQSHEGRHMFSGDAILSQFRVSFSCFKTAQYFARRTCAHAVQTPQNRHHSRV